MKLTFFLTCILVLSVLPSDAQVLRRCNTLFQDATTDADGNGTVFQIPADSRPSRLTGVFTATEVDGDTPTLDVAIQTCMDKAGTICGNLFSADQCTTGACYGGDSRQFIDANYTTINAFPYFRAAVNVGGTDPIYNLKVELCYD